jgi:hypothetical protein
VIAEYARAAETRDLALYRALMPGLSSEAEKRLREAFKGYKPQRVGITVDSVQLSPDGDRATVRATRQDVFDGRPTKAVSQTFQLVRVGAAWQIQSIGRSRPDRRRPVSPSAKTSYTSSTLPSGSSRTAEGRIVLGSEALGRSL